MLRDLDMNEMNAVSGGTDEVVATGTIVRWDAPTSISASEARAMFDNIEINQHLNEAFGVGGRNSDAYIMWLHAGNNVGITPAGSTETSTADDGGQSYVDCVSDSASAGAGFGGAVGSNVGRRGGYPGRVAGDAAGTVIGGFLGGAFGVATCVP